MPRARSEVVISRLEKYAGEWITDVARSKGYMVMSHYFSLPNHRGGILDPMQRYYTMDGKEITFKDVPIAKVTEAVERMIKTEVPADRRTEIYHKVLTGMPGHQPIPEWDTKSSTSIYEKPLTPFSKPRGAAASNQDLLDALAPAAEITLTTAKNIGTQIIWWDAMSDGAFSSMMSFDGGVRDGRLGRPHTLDDVPVNYFRDRLMDFINEDGEWPEDRKQAARKAICPDLTDNEIEEYTRLIAEDRKKREEEANRPPTPPTREERAKEILEQIDDVKTLDQAMKLIDMNEAVKEIDETIDWETPKLMGIRRGQKWGPKGLEGGVVAPPPMWALLGLEGVVIPDVEIDRDCDQVRAMIKTFLSSWDWCADSFRMALSPNITRARFTEFLKKRGTDPAQLKSAAYLLSWEFFNRRQKMGLSIVDVDFRDDYETLRKIRRNESLSEPERVLVKTHEEEVEALKEKHYKEYKALQDTQGKRRKALAKECVDRLKALGEARPQRLTRSKRSLDQSRQNESHSEQVRALAKKEEEEFGALYKEDKKELHVMQEAQYQEETALEKAHAEQLKALQESHAEKAVTEARPGKLNKRASDGVDGGKTKRTRSSR